MPKIATEKLRTIAAELLIGAGAPPEEAATVARHCVNANVAGHHSHGILQIPNYIGRIKMGHIVPGAPWEILRETESTTVVDGHWGFGYVVNERAMRLTIDKADRMGVAATTVARQGHIGRLASYPLMAIERGMIGLITADSGRSPKVVVPFGGQEPRLGTNPISIAVPSNLAGPMVLDMATSAVAVNKITLAEGRGQMIPQGWIIDSEGRQTTDPKAYKAGGMLLPLGGTEGYKGYGLGVMVEILCGLLTGLGFGVEPTGRHNDGCFMAVFKVDAFRPLARFKDEVTEFAAYLNATKPSEGSQGVLYPGELEYRRAQEHERDGVDVEDATWRKLAELACEYGLSTKLDLPA